MKSHGHVGSVAETSAIPHQSLLPLQLLPRARGSSVGSEPCSAVPAPHTLQVWGHLGTSSVAPVKASRHTLHFSPPSQRACFCSQSWMKEMRMQTSLILSGAKQLLCRQAFCVAACIAHPVLAVLGTAFELGLVTGMRVSSLMNSSYPRTIYRRCCSSSASLPNQLGVGDSSWGSAAPSCLDWASKTLKWPQALDQLLRETGPSPG